MTEENKKLLLKDLCARSSYGLKATTKSGGWPDVYNVEGYKNDKIYLDCPVYDEGDDEWLVESVIPYLRPMSSMTEEETEEYRSLSDEVICTYGPYNTECKFHCVRLGIKPDNPHECIDDYLSMDAIDWLNEHHFDYRGLIEKGLALEASEGMYTN